MPSKHHKFTNIQIQNTSSATRVLNRLMHVHDSNITQELKMVNAVPEELMQQILYTNKHTGRVKCHITQLTNSTVFEFL